MTSIRLNRNDWFFILGCLAILIGGIFFSRAYFTKAFPEATIDFKYDRDNSQPIAEKFLHAQGFQPSSDYMHGSAFSYDVYVKTYLEKELGNDVAQKYYGKPVLMWFWFHRWFKPGQKEEFQVQVTIDGKLSEFNHLIPEEAVGADLTQDSAKALAEDFLYKKYGLDSSKVKFYEVTKRGRPKRTDWEFTYRDATVTPVKGSDYRYYVWVQGAQVDRFWQYLFVPETWLAKYRSMRSMNEAAGEVDAIFFILTALAIGIIFFIKVRKKDVQWRTAIWFGAIGSFLFLLERLNSFTSGFVGYNTTDPWSGYITKELGMTLMATILMGVAIMLLTASAEAMYREHYPNKISIPRVFSIRGLRTKSAFKNILLGLTMCSFFFAYQIIFYLTANKFGAWSPVDVPYDDLLKTTFPWAAVLLMGFFPAVSEEFMSRAFSIPFLQKLFKGKMTWLALVIAAGIWGFGHAGYPNEPWFIRGMEVGIAGIIVGIIMLRFGILATLVWHYSVDALYTSFLFFRSSNMYLIVTGAIAAGLLTIPLLLALIAYLRKGTFEPEEGLSNADISTGTIESVDTEPTPVTQTETLSKIETVSSTAVTKPAISGNVIAIALFVVGLVLAFIPVSKLGENDEYKISSDKAIKTVSDSLRACGWANPDTLHFYISQDLVASPINDSFEMYLLQHVKTVNEANSIIKERIGNPAILVRAFRPESRTKYFARVDAVTGKILSLWIILPEETAGDSLSKDSARTIVENVFKARSIDLSNWDMKEYSQEAKPKRIDHYFTYEAKEGDPRNVGEAKYRMSASIVGRYLIVNGRNFYKVPEKWQREQNATTMKRAIYVGVIMGIVILAVLLMLWRLLQLTRTGQVPWKKVLWWSIIPGIVLTLGNLNMITRLYDTYFWKPEIPWMVYRITMVAGIAIGSIGTWIFLVLCMALIAGLYPNLGDRFREAKRGNIIGTILFSALATIGIRLIGSSLSAITANTHPTLLPPGVEKPVEWLYAPYPFFSMLGMFVDRIVIWGAAVAFLHSIWSKVDKSLLLKVAILIVLICVGLPREALTRAEVLHGFIQAIVFAILLGVLFVKVTAGNPLAILASLLTGLLLAICYSSFGSGNPELVVPTVLAVCLILAAFLNWLYGKEKVVAK